MKLMELEYGAAGFTGIGTSTTASTTSYSATGLTSQTDYEFYVQQIVEMET